MPLLIEHRDVKPGVVVIALAGRVMLGAESVQIETLVQELLKQGRRHFIFDLSGVTHIDSTGIGRFISGLNMTLREGGSLRMAGAAGQVRDSFRVTRLDTVFKFYPDAESASQDLA
jgi:anti-sigma B factor antagonist